MTQYYNHMFLGAVHFEDSSIHLGVFAGLDPNEYVRVIDRDGQPATARAGQLDPIFMQDTESSDESGEEIEISFTNKIPIGTVLENLVAELGAGELIEFIKILDERAQDWFVTEQLFEYFREQHDIFMKEEEGKL